MPPFAWCGCTPAVAHTRPRWRRATRIMRVDDSTSVPTVTRRSTPASSAAVTTASPTSPSSRWQWLSVQRARTHLTYGRVALTKADMYRTIRERLLDLGRGLDESAGEQP